MSHTPGPWNVNDDGSLDLIAPDGRWLMTGKRPLEELKANATLQSAAPELLAYAKCEDARASGEDIAETVLTQHGWLRGECTSHEFMDRMRRAAIAKAEGK